MAFKVEQRSQVAAFGNYPGPLDALTAAKLVTAQNYHRQQGTIAHTSDKKWRVDAQKPSQTHANIQIQLNDVGAPSTAACALVPLKFHDELQSAPAMRKHSMAAELTSAINSALHRSAKSRMPVAQGFKIFVFEVVGAFSS